MATILKPKSGNEILSILTATSLAPKECANCVAFCQEGHIDIPCKGSFECEERRTANDRA